MIFPLSGIGVTKSSTLKLKKYCDFYLISNCFPAIVIKPTELSGFAWNLALETKATASCWASHLDGK